MNIKTLAQEINSNFSPKVIKYAYYISVLKAASKLVDSYNENLSQDKKYQQVMNQTACLLDWDIETYHDSDEFDTLTELYYFVNSNNK